MGGGSSMVMTELKEVFVSCGFDGVATYIQSGNAAHGPRPAARGSRLTARGSRLTAHGSRPRDLGSKRPLWGALSYQDLRAVPASGTSVRLLRTARTSIAESWTGQVVGGTPRVPWACGDTHGVPSSGRGWGCTVPDVTSEDTYDTSGGQRADRPDAGYERRATDDERRATGDGRRTTEGGQQKADEERRAAEGGSRRKEGGGGDGERGGNARIVIGRIRVATVRRTGGVASAASRGNLSHPSGRMHDVHRQRYDQPTGDRR
nr:DUF1697 domain-containing protein [Micromonospora provocatoris]